MMDIFARFGTEVVGRKLSSAIDWWQAYMAVHKIETFPEFPTWLWYICIINKGSEV